MVIRFAHVIHISTNHLSGLLMCIVVSLTEILMMIKMDHGAPSTGQEGIIKNTVTSTCVKEKQMMELSIVKIVI